MPYRFIPFSTDSYYHIYNRGVEKRVIFLNRRDYQRFLQTLYYYQFAGPKPPFSKQNQLKYQTTRFSKNPKIVEIIAYCLMPNHFHLLLRQNQDGGIHKFMQQVLNSYTKYFNTKKGRVGPLLQGTFKATPIEDDNQLTHLSRYIHLNPFVSELTPDLDNYTYSSYLDYVGNSPDSICNTKPVLSLFKNQDDYREFVIDHSDYAKEVETIKHLLFE